MSGIRPPDCSKLAKNPKNDNDVTIFRHDVIVNFFWRCFVSLVRFSYWSKFHVNIITGSGVMTVLFYKGLTRNPEIGNTPSEFWPISGNWGSLGIPNLARMSLMKCYEFLLWMSLMRCPLLNAAKCQCYSFYRFWVIKGKPIMGGGGGKIILTQIRFKFLSAVENSFLVLWHI